MNKKDKIFSEYAKVKRTIIFQEFFVLKVNHISFKNFFILNF